MRLKPWFSNPHRPDFSPLFLVYLSILSRSLQTWTATFPSPPVCTFHTTCALFSAYRDLANHSSELLLPAGFLNLKWSPSHLSQQTACCLSVPTLVFGTYSLSSPCGKSSMVLSRARLKNPISLPLSEKPLLTTIPHSTWPGIFVNSFGNKLHNSVHSWQAINFHLWSTNKIQWIPCIPINIVSFSIGTPWCW